MENQISKALQAAGFEVVSTGGGCTGWRKDLKPTPIEAAAGHILLTSQLDGGTHRIGAEGILLGIYDDEGECLSVIYDAPLEHVVGLFGPLEQRFEKFEAPALHPASAGLFRATLLHSRNLSFEAFGASVHEARSVLDSALALHAEQFSLPVDWCDRDDIHTEELRPGAAYRDREQILPRS